MKAMRAEIREQPAVLERVRDALGPEIRSALRAEGPARRLHLAGCGDMYFAAEAACRWARLAGAGAVEAHRAMDLRWEADRLGAGDRVVVASFSGRTARAVEAARLARGAGAWVWAITGNRGSPVTEGVDRTLLLPTGPPQTLEVHPYAGYHANVPQTKTFAAVLWVELAAAFGGIADSARRERALAALDPVPAHMARDLSGLDIAAERAIASAPPFSKVLVLASGPWLPMAWYGAAKWLEFAVPARGQCLEEVNHLEAFVADRETLAIIAAPDERSLTRAEELVEAGIASLGLALVWVRPAAARSDPRLAGPAVAIERAGSIPELFAVAAALALLAFHGARRMGRDVERWVGGVRTALIEDLSRRTIRGSMVCDGFDEPIWIDPPRAP